MPNDITRTRNFCIVAHIDHGKSTLADRFIERAKLITTREFQDQMLDSMDIERERGITIKSQAVTLNYEAADGTSYIYNLVDTPGHVDFTYEVSRAISACEGAILLVDATQGVEAQTLSNAYLAIEHDLEIIPVLNKIDLPGAEPERVLHEIEDELGLPTDNALRVSAKTGAGIDDLLEAIAKQVPSPTVADETGLQALVFDSHYDSYRGVILHVRVFAGSIRPGQEIRVWTTGMVYKVEEVGRFRLRLQPEPALEPGDVGYIIAGIKTISDVAVGDTITRDDQPCSGPLPGFREVKPVVFSSVYPVDSSDYDELARSMERLKLNDASLRYDKDNSVALGFGFRCGFLGMLHLEVVQERLEREYDQAVVFTVPSVRYDLVMRTGERLEVDNPTDFPDVTNIEEAYEPYIRADIFTPEPYVGSVISLCTEKRGIQIALQYLDPRRVQVIYEMPLAEVLFDFHDRLKSLSRGYASYDYEIIGMRRTDIVRLDILVNGKQVDALSQLVHRSQAASRARTACRRLRDEIPRQQFKIPIQGAIGGQIVARETISAFRKDVTAKCYGGDISRKRKLLEKQKEGKKRMKTVGNVEIPQSAFLSVLKTSEE